MKKIILALLITMLSVTLAGAIEQKTPPNPAVTEKREYTPAEFHKAVLEEVEKVLVKTKQEKFVEITKELLNKEQEFKLQALSLEKEREQLNLNKREFEKKIQAFYSIQQKLIGCLESQDNLKDKRVDHMVDVVSNMKPDSAAQLLSAQEVDLAVSILGKLEAVKVSKIFNLMDKEISARLQKQYLNMKR
ncbi:MAG: hypothetical protein A2X86_07450 [Bdellovibrionales bacterium GWA2_49_15]|nr:MAG: hypothetical protein A2X86_07450 [Bdellovibrionales bacterium GWA2_49_15]HAZ11887.1 hypothetical protein [Bdellovibrionales bacterium]